MCLATSETVTCNKESGGKIMKKFFIYLAAVVTLVFAGVEAQAEMFDINEVVKGLHERRAALQTAYDSAYAEWAKTQDLGVDRGLVPNQRSVLENIRETGYDCIPLSYSYRNMSDEDLMEAAVAGSSQALKALELRIKRTYQLEAVAWGWWRKTIDINIEKFLIEFRLEPEQQKG